MARSTVAGAAAGTSGAAWRRVLSFPSKAAGNYVVNETNFAGVGQYLPCNAIITMTPGAGGGAIQVSSDNGTTWHAMNTVAAATQFGAYVYLDTANTIRVVITTNAASDLRIFIQ